MPAKAEPDGIAASIGTSDELGQLPDVSDTELSRDYGQHGSDAAFAGLVKRHLNRVIRQRCAVGIAARAEEITKAVICHPRAHKPPACARTRFLTPGSMKRRGLPPCGFSAGIGSHFANRTLACNPLSKNLRVCWRIGEHLKVAPAGGRRLTVKENLTPQVWPFNLLRFHAEKLLRRRCWKDQRLGEPRSIGLQGVPN